MTTVFVTPGKGGNIIVHRMEVIHPVQHYKISWGITLHLLFHKDVRYCGMCDYTFPMYAVYNS